MPSSVSIAATGGSGSSEVIGRDWFGAVQTGFHHFSGFDAAARAFDIGLLRWPGGTLAETRPEVYGLEHEGLFDATDLWKHNPDRTRPDLADSLDYAVEHDLHFSMVVPTARYVGAIDQGEAHLSDFLDDLFTGKYGALPREFTLELGNEYYALPEFRDDAAAYGEIAARFAEVIGESSALYLTAEERAHINVAVQMGDSAQENADILAQFSPEALSVTDSVVFHSLPISLRNLNKDQFPDLDRYEMADAFFMEWKDAIEAAGGTADPDLFMSAWTVGGSTNNPDNIDLVWHDYGLRAASVVLESVAGYASIGVDAAAIWGVDVHNLNSVTKIEGGDLYLSHSGEMFRMLADALPGSQLLHDFTPSSRDDAVMSYAFGDSETITSYIAINTLQASNTSVALDFGPFHNIRLMSAELLSTRLDPSFNGAIEDAEARLYEIPVLTQLTDLFTPDGIVLDFAKSFEVAEVQVALSDSMSGSPDPDWISGTLSSDRIHGLAGDDMLISGGGFDLIVGGEGDDRAFGGNGRDRLYGEAGNDTLHGGLGDDLLNGGAGTDTLVGGPGADRFQYNVVGDQSVIRDFELGRDEIDLADLFQSARAVQISGPSGSRLFTDGSGGITAEYRIAIQQQNADALMDVFDRDGGEVISVRLKDVSAEDLAQSRGSFRFFDEDSPSSDDLPRALASGSPAPAAAAQGDLLAEASGFGYPGFDAPLFEARAPSHIAVAEPFDEEMVSVPEETLDQNEDGDWDVLHFVA
ncbi:MAG: calcium-binding protein [Pseudomonadota bacterium]